MLGEDRYHERSRQDCHNNSFNFVRVYVSSYVIPFLNHQACLSRRSVHLDW